MNENDTIEVNISHWLIAPRVQNNGFLIVKNMEGRLLHVRKKINLIKSLIKSLDLDRRTAFVSAGQTSLLCS